MTRLLSRYSKQELDERAKGWPTQTDPFFGVIDQDEHSTRRVAEPYADEDGEPFIVQVTAGFWVPISLLIFAKDEEQAKSLVRDRVLEALNRPDVGFYQSKAEEILELIDEGFIFCKKFDKRFAAKVEWAANGTIF